MNPDRTVPKLMGFIRLHRRLLQFPLYRRYGWAVLPLLVLTIFQLNTHTYYDLFQGYDMPQHFYNTYVIMKTGQMPPPPLHNMFYEAHQAPLFYLLSAPVAALGDHFFGDGFKSLIPFALFIASLAWILMLIALVQVVMRRVPAWLRALTVSVIALFPMNIEASVMYGNDLPVIALGTLAGFTLWLMLRSGRQLELKMWLRSAALCGYTILFKNNGVALLAVYGGLAAYLILDYLRRRQWKLALKVARMSALGLPLMLVPWGINAYHASRYLPDLLSITSGQTGLSPASPRFFLNFDASFFTMPFAFGPGEASFWSLQYVTLHNDYYNHWTLRALSQVLPPEVLIRAPHRFDFPYWHLFEAVLLQYLAVSITLLMVVPLLAALLSLIRDFIPPAGRHRRALRTGSVLVLLLAFAAEAAQFVRFINYPNVRAVVIHARFQGYLFGFLLILGLVWYWKHIGRRGGWLANLLTAGIGLNMLGYAVVSFALMWQLPTW